MILSVPVDGETPLEEDGDELEAAAEPRTLTRGRGGSGRDRRGLRREAARETAAIWSEWISESVGRDSASATTLSTPDTCRTSVVNSEMYERCLVCRGERSVEEVIAPHRGR